MTATAPYRPSNGDEGMDFHARFCERCIHDAEWREEAEGGCTILRRTLFIPVDDPDYPAEWIEDADGPRCTAFKREATDGETTIWDKRQVDMFAGVS